MLRHPRFKPHFRVAVIEPDTVFLLSEGGQFLLRGSLYCQLAPLVDGLRTPEEITACLRGRVSALAVAFGLEMLERRGYVCDAGNALPLEQAAFWHERRLSPDRVVERLGAARVAVVYEGRVERGPFERALGLLGIRCDNAGDLAVVLTDDYLRPGLGAHNAAGLAASRPWLLAKPVGSEIWLGPLFRPGQTGCWECLADRLRGNRGIEGFVARKLPSWDRFAANPAATPLSMQLGCTLAAQEVAQIIAGVEQPTLEGVVLTLDSRTLTLEKHVLTRRPQCPACGAPARPDELPRPILPTSSPKLAGAGGEQRSCTPEQTLAKYERHVSPITGVVSALARTPVDDSPLPQRYLSGPNLGRAWESVEGLRAGLRLGSGGKGTSESQARASALAEAIERRSGTYRGDEPRTRASFRELGERAIHPASCLNFSDRQYAQRAVWNACRSWFNRVPAPFDESETVEWTPLWSLTRGEHYYLLTAYCYYSYPSEPERAFCWADSNGCAAGGTLEEAIAQGLLELVERDSIALWWYNRAPRPGVDLASFQEPYVAELAAWHRGVGRALWALDLTSDLGIPAFVALSSTLDAPGRRIMLGFGAHFDPRTALLRAVTELNQTYAGLANASGAELDELAREDAALADWWRGATLENQPYLRPSAECAPRRRADFVDLSTSDLRDDVLLGQQIVERAGLEMLVLDQTRADIGLPVARVVVPGLRHFWARFGPGRLYDVPTRLGWLPAPLIEDQLNPIPMFL